MYTQQDLINIKIQLKKRWLITLVPSLAVLAAAIVIFVYGQLNRNDELWMLTSTLTMIGGSYLLFFFGVYVRPAMAYRKHLGYMLNGRKRETTGLFKAFSQDVCIRDGLEVHAMLVNVGEKDDPEDDRLFYYDVYKAAPEMAFGERVTVVSNDKMVASITRV